MFGGADIIGCNTLPPWIPSLLIVIYILLRKRKCKMSTSLLPLLRLFIHFKEINSLHTIKRKKKKRKTKDINAFNFPTFMFTLIINHYTGFGLSLNHKTSFSKAIIMSIHSLQNNINM